MISYRVCRQVLGLEIITYLPVANTDHRLLLFTPRVKRPTVAKRDSQCPKTALRILRASSGPTTPPPHSTHDSFPSAKSRIHNKRGLCLVTIAC